MPESSGMGRSREVSPQRASHMPLAAPNSPARRATRNTSMLEPYHDIASTFFSVGNGADLDDIFLTASRGGDYERIFELLRRRNEAIINIDTRDRLTGNTPLIWASKRGHGKIVQLLLKHGADVTLRNYEGTTAVEVASPAIRIQLLESVDKGGPHRNLLQAAWQGNAKLLKKILSEARVDINCRNADGLTPLLLVTRDVQLFEKLQSRGRGFEPQQVVSELLTSRADPNAVDEEGRSSLHYVSSSKAFQGSDLIKMLLRDGSDVHDIISCIRASGMELMSLSSNKVTPELEQDSRDRRCFTPIHCASLTGNVEIVVALLDGGADANARGYAGTTPLHISAINGHDSVVNKLLQRGADVMIVDDSGLTAVDVAKTKKVKQTLKQAWAEATQVKVKENLGPVRPPSTSSRRSFDGAIAAPPPSKSPKKGGQVIFDLNLSRARTFCSPTPSELSAYGMGRTLSPLSPLTTSHIDLTLPTTSTSSLDALTPRRAAVTLLQRQLDAEKIHTAEDCRMRDVISAMSVTSRSRTPSAKTPRGISGQHLSPLRNASPGKNCRREIKFSANTKDHDGGRNSTASTASTASTPGRRKSTDQTPTLQRECSIPVTILGFDSDDGIHDARMKRGAQSPSRQVLSKKGVMCRSFSSEASFDTSDDLQLRGCSSSRTSLSTNPDWEETTPLGDSPPNPTSIRMPSASSQGRLTTIEERSTTSETRQPVILDLDQMRVINLNQSPIFGDSTLGQHLNSQHLLPPTPVYMTNGDYGYGPGPHAELDCDDFSGSSKENSPRSDEEMDHLTVNHQMYSGEVRLAVTDVNDLLRPKSMLNQGPFNIEATRTVSDNSGCSKNISSTSRSSVNSSNGNAPHAVNQNNESHRKTVMVANGAQSLSNVHDPRVKLRIAAKENATVKMQPASAVPQPSVKLQGNAAKNQVTVHSDALTVNMDSNVQPTKWPRSDCSKYSKLSASAPLPSPRVIQTNSTSSKHEPLISQHGELSNKLVPNKTSDHLGPPSRPPPPSDKSVVRKLSVDSITPGPALQPVTKQAPPRPVAPPRSRTPSASSVSSSGSGSSKEAPTRPTPPTCTAATIKPTIVKPSVTDPKKSTPGHKSAKPSSLGETSMKAKKPLVTQTTTFRLSTYLAKKEAKDSVPVSLGGVNEQSVPQQAKVFTSPAIILTSQSQTQFDLSAIPDVLTTQPPNDDEPVLSTAPQVKQIQVKEASPQESATTNPGFSINDGVTKSVIASISEVKLNEKPTQSEHSGPVIWDPFETIKAERAAKQNENGERSKISRTKSATKRKAYDRQPSAVQRGSVSKSKEVVKSHDGKRGMRSKSPRGRPKSPRSRSKSPRSVTNKKTKKKKKGKKSDNKVEVLMPDHPDLMDNVGYISGVGWQVSTESNEDEPLHQVRFGRPPLDYDTDDEPTPRLTVVPNYVAEHPSLSELVLSDVEDMHNQYLQLPGQMMYDEDIDTATDADDDLDYLLPDAEDTVNEVIFDLTPRVINGVLIDTPNNKMLSPKNILKRGGTVDDDLEEIVPVDNVSSSRRSSNEAEEGEVKQFAEEKPKDELNEDNVFEELPSLKPFDKKGLMGKGKPPNRMELTSAQKKNKVPPKNTSATSTKCTPHTTSKAPRSTPGGTPKQTPGTTPKVTPSTTPKQTPSNTPKTTPAVSPKKIRNSSITPAASPQAPPRKSKLGRITSATITPQKPTPLKRNSTKIQQNQTNVKENPKEEEPSTKEVVDDYMTTAESAEEKEASIPADEATQVNAPDKSEPEIDQQRKPLSNNPANLIQDTQVSDDGKDDLEKPKLQQMISKDEDTEIDAMIDEILKSTPHPSMSLSLKSNKSDGEQVQRTPEEIIQISIEARNRLESELNKSQNGKIFSQVPVQQLINTGDVIVENEAEEPDVQISLKEQHELEKLMNSLRKMELTISSKELTISSKDRDEYHNMQNNSSTVNSKVNSEDSSSHNSPPNKNLNKNRNNKPPLPPGTVARTDYSRSSSHNALAKSPQFIRKIDTWKDGGHARQLPPDHVDTDDDNSDSDSLAEIDFNSDELSVASAFSEKDDSIIPKDGRVMTSCIGRKSVAEQSSAMSNHESCSEDNVETIQWKRGNMLGKGAYGKVWCGLTNAGELIAVKQIELNINDMDQAELEYEKIQEEVELLKTLKHTNIVGYLGTSLEDNMVSIFMQFIPGGSIANLLARFGALEEEVFSHYTRQILEGVAYLHQNNIIHRDIKGGNVMLMHNAIIKLIDFGCAKRLCLNINSLSNSNKGLLKSMRGTPYWMAPEVVRETGYGTKSDIWSIGCTVYEMAMRKPPWADVPPMAAIFAIGTERETPGLPEKFSFNARDFVSQCMTHDQNLRPSAPELLKHDFVRRKRKR